MLGVIVHSFPGELTPSLIMTATQLGYDACLLLLVPLGDLLEPRWLIVSQFLILALSLLFAAAAPTEWSLLGASLCIGFSADVEGLFGIIGMIGGLAAPIAGRLAGTRGAGQVVSAGAFITLLV
jgi:MFS family permease